MRSMAGARKVKMIEQWLRRVASGAEEKAMDGATAAYYLSLSRSARAEDESLGRSLSAAARRVYRIAPGTSEMAPSQAKHSRRPR